MIIFTFTFMISSALQLKILQKNRKHVLLPFASQGFLHLVRISDFSTLSTFPNFLSLDTSSLL